MKRLALLGLPLSLVLALLVAAFAPLERTLGVNARIVYLHGAWVWVALALFILSALAGLLGLLLQRRGLQTWCQALGRTALFFWITFLPMSLYVMQANWNGLFLDEPRFRIPLNFAIVGLLLQLGLSYFPLAWTCAVNVGYTVVLLVGMSQTQAVLHPESPIFNAGTGDIQIFFAALFGLLLLGGLMLAGLWRGWNTKD
jgi:hypothetical protein